MALMSFLRLTGVEIIFLHLQSSWRQYVSLAFGMALEADPPEVLVRSVANPRSLLTFVLGYIYNKFALWT